MKGIVEIDAGKFLQICREVYDAGMSGCGELKDSSIEEIMTRNGISVADNWKVYTVKELSDMTPGTVFTHSVWGRCWVSQRPDEGVKFMSFLSRGPVDFRSNSDPWDKPMKLVGLG